MGVTAIKRVHNDSTRNVYISSTEPAEVVNAGPGESRRMDIWIPWATTEAEWEEHQIYVTVWRMTDSHPRFTLRRYSIFQGVQSDRRDRVRCLSSVAQIIDGYLGSPAPDCRYVNPAPDMAGVASVNGDRRLIVHADMSISLSRTL